MSALSDKSIRALCVNDNMIQPFTDTSVKVNALGERIASYGISSAGYDLRAAPEFKIFKPLPKPSLWKRFKNWVTGREHEDPVLDYKKITEDMFESVFADSVVVPPGGFLLTRSKEYVKMPRDAVALCIGKSTIARAGWNCLCTPIEPEWEGFITFEFHNTTNRPNRFYADEGVLQLVWFRMDEECDISYKDRGGKYMGQGSEIVLPKV